jgi:hypothetical protein
VERTGCQRRANTERHAGPPFTKTLDALGNLDMDEASFWKIIESVHQTAHGDTQSEVTPEGTFRH